MSPRRRLAVPFLAILLLAGACSSEAPNAPSVGARWIEEDAESTFEPERFVERIVRFEWRLDDPQIASSFRVVNHQGPLRKTREGVEVPSATPFVRLIRPVELAASEIHLIEVDIAGATRGHAQLFWAGQGETFSAERKVQVPVKAAEGTVVFDLSTEPNWTGSIRRLSITPTTAPEQTVVLKAVRAIERRLDPNALSGVVARPWKVQLGDDLRNALLAPPGLCLEKELKVPRGARLRVAFGVRPRPLDPVVFRVSARRASKEPEVLFERRLQPDSLAGWSDVEVDLAPYGGRTATIVLETLMAGQPDLTRMVPVWGNPQLVVPAAAPQPPNIILISIDTLRADRMSAYGHSRPTTPGLDAWARESGVRFETVVAPAPWTLPSHISLFSGLDAATHGFNYDAPAHPSLVTLAERLREAGYSTAAFTAGAYLDPQFGLSQGFDLFRSRQDRPAKKETSLELVEGIAQLRSWLAQPAARPFFAFLHSYEVHTPYRARQPYFERFGGDVSRMPSGRITVRTVPRDQHNDFLRRREFVFADPDTDGETAVPDEDLDIVEIAYDSGVGYMDHHVSRLLADLPAMGLGSDTVVVFTSDHGEMLGEHGLAAHGYLYDENLLVPLILALPGGRGRGRVVADQVRLTDVFPTLLELAGLEPRQAIDGESVLPLVDRAADGRSEVRHRDAWSYAPSTSYGLSLRYADRLKYILRNSVWPPVQGEEEVYDLRRDPREMHNLAADFARTAALRSRAGEYLESRSFGVRVRLSNAGTTTLSGRLRGSIVRKDGVTSPDLSCRCLRWLGANQLAFEVPAGASYTLHLEHAGSDSLAIEGDLAPGGPRAALRRVVDLSNLDRPLELAFDGNAWVGGAPGAGARPAAVRVRVWRQGEARSGGAVPVEDAALREQLRALGYLN